MNIYLPDISSKAYQQFADLVNDKVRVAMSWLEEHHIEYVWNNWINGHLYRLYIPAKDILLDFETYPVRNPYYEYCRINYDTNIITALEQLFPQTIVDTNDMSVYKQPRRIVNRFLKEQDISPVYDQNVLRFSWVKDDVIYQSIVVKDNTIIRNVVKHNCAVPYGTYVMLRYLNELWGMENIRFTESLDNSFKMQTWQILNLPIVTQTNKRKIWWSPQETKWRIHGEEKSEYVPFYFTENVTYLYPPHNA